jgi:hypothetical protein
MFKQQGKFYLLQSSNFCLNQIRLFAKVFKKSEKEKGKKIRKREKAPGQSSARGRIQPTAQFPSLPNRHRFPLLLPLMRGLHLSSLPGD